MFSSEYITQEKILSSHTFAIGKAKVAISTAIAVVAIIVWFARALATAGIT